jgi:hypothetical protein
MENYNFDYSKLNGGANINFTAALIITVILIILFQVINFWTNKWSFNYPADAPAQNQKSIFINYFSIIIYVIAPFFGLFFGASVFK